MKKVEISYEWWSAVVEIDETPETLEYMKEQLMFWTGGERRIDYEDGDVETAYLKALGEEMISETIRNNIHGIVNYFSQAEGWAPLDASFGVRLVSVDSWEFETNEFVIQELQ